MKVYFVSDSMNVVGNKGYTKMADARKVQRDVRSTKTNKNAKAAVAVNSIEVSL